MILLGNTAMVGAYFLNLLYTHKHKHIPLPLLPQSYVIECACCCSVSWKQNSLWIPLYLDVLPPTVSCFLSQLTFFLFSKGSKVCKRGRKLTIPILYLPCISFVLECHNTPPPPPPNLIVAAVQESISTALVLCVGQLCVLRDAVWYCFYWHAMSLCCVSFSLMFCLERHVCSLIGSHCPLWPHCQWAPSSQCPQSVLGLKLRATTVQLSSLWSGQWMV